jgi:hypothetical protein
MTRDATAESVGLEELGLELTEDPLLLLLVDVSIDEDLAANDAAVEIHERRGRQLTRGQFGPPGQGAERFYKERGYP